MKVSIVICTKNGADRLKQCFESLELLKGSDSLDVHVVDNGSTDGLTPQIIQDYLRSSRHDVSAYEQLKPGNSAGRNTAIPHVKGDIVLFTDDDCYVDPDFVLDWIDQFSNSDIGYGCGMIVPYDRKFSDEGCNEFPDERHMNVGQFVWRGFLTGSNMAFRRECLKAIGLFDERFGSGVAFAAEDWDMSLRAYAKKWKGKYSPKPKVFHDHRRTRDATDDRWRFYDYGAGAVYAKHSISSIGPRIVRELMRELKQNRRPHVREDLMRGYKDFFRMRLTGANRPS